MEGNKLLKNSQIIVLGLCIALSTIISAVIISQALMKIKKFTAEVIEVTGSAEKDIISSYIVWKSEFSRRDALMTQAHAQLKADLKTVREYLLSRGINDEEMIVPQVETIVLYRKNEKGNDTNDIEGYLLNQKIEVRSAEVKKVAEISRQATDLIDRGIQFVSQAPEYFYTKLAELKVEMLAKATENAKQRAESMADATGARIGFMRSAKMGVFQVTPVNSTEVSDWGINDTTSLEKKVTAVVRATFALS